MSKAALCRLDDIASPGAKGPLRAEIDGQMVAIFVVRRKSGVHAYVDRCPHVGAPLAMEPDRFLDLSGTEIICSMHGARFDLATGACTLGPCRGKALTSVPVAVQNGEVVLV